MAFLDVISPCVAFNNHEGSTKSYEHIRHFGQNVVNADFIDSHEEITADYQPGTLEELNMPDGSLLRLYKLDDSYDPHDRVGALNYVQRRGEEGDVVTGLLYLDPDASDCHDILDTVARPLNELNETDLCPGNGALAGINESFR
jgi:2-oxoglutarate ferredoxin oxidoreductase subunit beta